MKKLFFTCLTIIVLLNIWSCNHKVEGVKLVYKFEQNKKFQSDNKLTVKLKINKILLPNKNRLPSDSSSNFLRNDSILKGIRDIVSKNNLKTLELNLITNRTETVTLSKKDSADISRKSEIVKFLINANDQIVPLDENFSAIIKLIIREEQKRKRKFTGEWFNLPKIMGIDLTPAQNDPYLSKLLLYVQKGFTYPDNMIYNGYKWDSNLHILIPVDSLSKGQSQGYILIDIKNNQELVKTEKNIANIKIDLLINVSWEVNLPDQGFTKCNFIFNGKGFRFFDIKKGWDYGMFLKGDTELKIDAETIDKDDTKKRIPIVIDADGVFEIASKIKK
jgi:hypothetical protein